jgi:putative transcriptional regulator
MTGAVLALLCWMMHGLHAHADDPPAQLLIARPGMLDPGFAESVVLVTFPPDTGPMGVILNKPTPSTLHDAFPDSRELRNRTDIVYWGGPVQPNGMLSVFRSPVSPKQAIQVIGDIYFSGDGDILDKLFSEKSAAGEQRFFVGFAEWAEGQLEWEISQGAWYTLPADANVIFNMDARTMWRELYKGARSPRIQARLSPDAEGQYLPARALVCP